MWSVCHSWPGPVSHSGLLKHSRNERSREEKLVLITATKIWRGEFREGTGANVLSSVQVKLGEQARCSSLSSFNFPLACPRQIEACRITILPYLPLGFLERMIRQMSVNPSGCKIKNVIPGFQETGWPVEATGPGLGTWRSGFSKAPCFCKLSFVTLAHISHLWLES